MKIKRCTVFGYKTCGSYTHMCALDEEHEEKLAALMIKENRSISNEIERALDIHFAQYSIEKRNELLAEVERRRGKDGET